MSHKLFANQTSNSHNYNTWSTNAQISFCSGSLKPAGQLGSKLSNSLSLFLLVSTSNDLTYFAYLARKFSLFAFTAGWSQAKMMCWTSCVTLQWGHRSV